MEHGAQKHLGLLSTMFHLYSSLRHLTIAINRKHSGIWWFRVVPVGKYDVEVAAMFGPFSVTWGRIGFGVRMGMVIDHLAVVGVDVIKNTHEVGLGNN